MLFCVESFDTHDIFSFAYNFLNNGPIFTPIGPLELSQSPLASCGVECYVYVVFYVSFDTHDLYYIVSSVFSVCSVPHISTLTTCTSKT